MKKILIIFGTRPELIKMASVAWAMKGSQKLKPVLCATAQHRDLLDQGLRFFDLKADHDLNLMQANQTLADITTRCLSAIEKLLSSEKPDLILVQGDTTTALATGLAAFYAKVPVGHIEAGLRTEDKYSPFPEEVNRRLLSVLAEFHFAPTATSVRHLTAEHISPDRIFCVGNTGIDTLLWTSARRTGDVAQKWPGKKLILMTTHRRENFGEPLRKILSAVVEFAKSNPDFQIVYPVHPNPNVKQVVETSLKGLANITLLPPLDYGEIVDYLKASYFILTDSGGLQEEGPALHKPVLVLRENTERPEAAEAGAAKLVGHDPKTIIRTMNELKDPNGPLYRAMSASKNPFGDGTAAQKVVAILEKALA